MPSPPSPTSPPPHPPFANPSIATSCLTANPHDNLIKPTPKSRHKAIRMSREKQIPALAIHCAAQFPSQKTCLQGTLHSLFENEGDAKQPSHVQKRNLGYGEAPPPLLDSSPGAIVIYDGRLLNSKASGCGGEVSQSFSDCSGGDGDVSDVGSDRAPDLFELRNWRDDGSSSPLSSTSISTYERRVNVTRAVSECSTEDDDENDDDDGIGASDKFLLLNHGLDMKYDWCAEDWKLQAEVLAAECSLLRVEKELALRKWKQGCAEMDQAVHMAQALSSAVRSMPAEGKKVDDTFGETLYSRSPLHCSFYGIQPEDAPQNIFEKIHDMPYSTSSFACEALRRLQDISNKSSYRVPQEDPTDALQERLQNLLLAARASVVEHGSPANTASNLKFQDVWDNSNGFGPMTMVGSGAKDSMLNNESEDKRCLVENAALRKKLDLMSLELSEAKAASAFVRRQYSSMLSGEGRSLFGTHSQQTLAEEMYCKAAIRQIVAQVQAETEQWSQMQDILHNLQQEMEILNEAREIWEERALRAEAQLLSLEETVHDWRCRAQSAEEEVALLRSEREILKNKIHSMKHRHAMEKTSWLEYDGSRLKEATALPPSDTQKNISAVVSEVEDKPRHANAGTQEDYALCESIVHSRNESGRSSVDLGTTSQRGFQKNIKKSLDLSNGSNDGNTSKSRLRNHRLSDQSLKIEPTRLDFCSKSSDVNSKVRHKNHKLSDPLPKVELTKLESFEPIGGNENKERKKARLFTFMENQPTSGRIDAQFTFIAESQMQDGILCHKISAGQDYTDHLISSKPKASLPAAPSSTPSRLPFGEIINIPTSPMVQNVPYLPPQNLSCCAQYTLADKDD